MAAAAPKNNPTMERIFGAKPCLNPKMPVTSAPAVAATRIGPAKAEKWIRAPWRMSHHAMAPVETDASGLI